MLKETIDTITGGPGVDGALEQASSTLSQLQMLQKRAEEIDLAIRLTYTYEFFKKSSGELALHAHRSVLPHSWTKVYRDGRALTQRYDLSPKAGAYPVDLPLGVTVVMGKSGSGKTRFAFDHLFLTAQANDMRPMYLAAFEPLNEVKMMMFAQPQSLPRIDFETDLAAALAVALMDDTRELIIVDSFRYLFYAAKGSATGKGGVNMSLFMDLTHLDRVATRLGKRLVILINPLSDDDAAFAAYTEAAVGAASAVIVISDAYSAKITNRYFDNRSFIALKLPRTAVSDANPRPAKTAASQEIGAEKGANPSINTTVFGRKT